MGGAGAGQPGHRHHLDEGLLADRDRPPAQRRNFKGQSLTGPTLAAVLWLLLGVWWLARGLLD